MYSLALICHKFNSCHHIESLNANNCSSDRIPSGIFISFHFGKAIDMVDSSIEKIEKIRDVAEKLSKSLKQTLKVSNGRQREFATKE